MLTRLEVTGFKNLLDFEIEFGPYTCIAGPNGSGKSNVFDAIALLSLLADAPLMEAAHGVRTTEGKGGDVRALFWTDGVTRSDSMRFAAEMIVPPSVTDDFGREAAATTTFLRYELELRYEPPSDLASFGRLVLVSEQLRHIKLGEAAGHLRWPHSKKSFRDHAVVGRRAGTAFISTIDDHGVRTIRVHQDGGSRGQPRPSPAETAPRTIISTTATSADPTILAARREFQSWRTLALEPTAMRSPDPFDAPGILAPNGAHLAAAIYRLSQRAKANGEAPEAVFARLAARASALTDVREIRIDRDDRRELLTLEARLATGGFLPARALSDGTLRFLALCALDTDPDVSGLICMEEPENGIHPARMQAMVQLVRGLAVDPTEPPGVDNPFRQVIANTHSPGFVQLQQPHDLLYAATATIRTNQDQIAETLRLLPMKGTWRVTPDRPSISVADIVAYLSAQPEAQLSLENPT